MEKWDSRVGERHDGVACVYGAMGDVVGHRYWAAMLSRAVVDEKECYPWSKKVGYRCKVEMREWKEEIGYMMAR